MSWEKPLIARQAPMADCPYTWLETTDAIYEQKRRTVWQHL